MFDDQFGQYDIALQRKNSSKQIMQKKISLYCMSLCPSEDPLNARLQHRTSGRE